MTQEGKKKSDKNKKLLIFGGVGCLTLILTLIVGVVFLYGVLNFVAEANKQAIHYFEQTEEIIISILEMEDYLNQLESHTDKLDKEVVESNRNRYKDLTEKQKQLPEPNPKNPIDIEWKDSLDETYRVYSNFHNFFNNFNGYENMTEKDFKDIRNKIKSDYIKSSEEANYRNLRIARDKEKAKELEKRLIEAGFAQ